MAEILLVNPARRPSKRKSNPKRRSAAQRRATAKLVAANRARAKGSAVMSNPKRRRRNPAKRRARAATATKVRYVTRHRNPAKRVSRRRRRNPIGLNSSGARPMSLFTPALVGALGATAINTVFNTIAPSLSSTFTTGYMPYVGRAALSLGLAMVAGRGGKHSPVMLQAAEGSLTVCLHDLIVNLSGGMGMTLGGMGVYMPGRNMQTPSANGRPTQLNGMNAYLTGSGSPAAQQMAQRQRAMAAQPQRMSGFGF